MKKIIIVMIIVVMGLVIMSSALKSREDDTQKQIAINEKMNVAVVSDGNDIIETEVTEQEIRLEIIYEKTFEDTIIDAIFDTMTASIEEARGMGWKGEAFNEEDKTDDKVLISYPKVLIVTDRTSPGKKTIKFLNKDGEEKQTIKIREYSKVVTSTKGKYILNTFYYNGDNDTGGGAVLYDNEGNVIWEKSEGAFSTVSDEGYTATGFVSPDGSWYPFQIYDPTGNKVKEITLPDWGVFDAGMCSNENYFIITYRGKAGFDSTGVIIINKNNEILLQKIFPGDIMPKSVFRTSNEKYIIISFPGEKIENKRRIIFLSLKKNDLLVKNDFILNSLGHSLLININNKAYIYSKDYGYLLEINIEDSKTTKIMKISSGLEFCCRKFYQLRNNKIKLFSLDEVEQ